MSVEHGNWDGSREVIDGNGPGDDFSVPYPKLHVQSGSSEAFLVNREIIGEGESSEHLTSYPVDDDNDFNPFVTRGGNLSSSSSSGLADSFDAEGGFNPRVVAPGEYTQTALMDNNSPQELDSFQTSPCPPVSDAIHEPLVDIVPQTQSPPVQIMQRIEPYDPLRIPTSIFDADSQTPHVDWSNASNESLFSIHLGNNSFNRDHGVSMREKPKPAEELIKPDELLKFSPSLSIPLTPTDDQSWDPPKEVNKEVIFSEDIKEAKSNPPDDYSRMPPSAQREDKKSTAPRQSASSSKSSGDSRSSFSFPVKRRKSLWYSCCHSCKCNCEWASSCHCCTSPSCSCAWLSCHCCKSRRARPSSCYSSNCSWPSCCCKRPSCNFRCSSFCNYSRALCCSWNCGCKGWCCHSSTVLGEGVKSTSGKVNGKVRPELESAPLSSKSKPKKSWCHWFSCSWGSCCGSCSSSCGSCRSCRSCHSCGSCGSCGSCSGSCGSCSGNCCSWSSCSGCRRPRCHCC